MRWSVGKNWIERMGMEEGSRRAEWWNSAEFNGGKPDKTYECRDEFASRNGIWSATG